MSKKVKFVLNRAAFRAQILKGEGTKALLQQKLGPDAKLEESATRARARVYGSMSGEAKDGSLSRRLGGA